VIKSRPLALVAAMLGATIPLAEVLHAAAKSAPSPQTPEAHGSPDSPLPGPVAGARITETYARMIAREAHFWVWPMINVYNRRLAFKDQRSPA